MGIKMNNKSNQQQQVEADLESLSPHVLEELHTELKNHFPQTQQETEIVLMEVSPHRLHAYWHADPWDLDAAKSQLTAKDSQLVLRFHDLSSEDGHPAHATFDIELDDPTGSRSIEVWQDSKKYNAELGLRDESGELIDLARSNTVELPSASPSPSLAANVITLTPAETRLYQPTTTKRPVDWRENASQPMDQTLQSKAFALDPNFPNAIDPPALEVTEDAEANAVPDTEFSSIDPEGLSPHETEDVTDEPFLVTQKDGDNEYSFPLWLPESEADNVGAPPESILTRFKSQDGSKLQSPDTGSDPEHFYDSPDRAASTTTGRRNTPASDSSSGPHPVSSFSLTSPNTSLRMELVIEGQTQPNTTYVLHGIPFESDAAGRIHLKLELPASSAKQVAKLLYSVKRKS